MRHLATRLSILRFSRVLPRSLVPRFPVLAARAHSTAFSPPPALSSRSKASAHPALYLSRSTRTCSARARTHTHKHARARILTRATDLGRREASPDALSLCLNLSPSWRVHSCECTCVMCALAVVPGCTRSAYADIHAHVVARKWNVETLSVTTVESLHASV